MIPNAKWRRIHLCGGKMFMVCFSQGKFYIILPYDYINDDENIATFALLCGARIINEVEDYYPNKLYVLSSAMLSAIEFFLRLIINKINMYMCGYSENGCQLNLDKPEDVMRLIDSLKAMKDAGYDDAATNATDAVYAGAANADTNVGVSVDDVGVGVGVIAATLAL